MIMKIYAVECFTVDEVDENGGFLQTSAVSPDDLYTTDIYEAFRNFKSRIDSVKYGDSLDLYEVTLDCEEDAEVSLNSREFDEKYGSVKETQPREIIAEYFNHELASVIYFDVVEHMVRQSCRYFNMHEICKAAGVNYSTFRGFKNNRQYFSEEKLLAILRTMNRVGVSSWNNDLAVDIETVRGEICRTA